MELEVACLKCAGELVFVLAIRKAGYLCERRIRGSEGHVLRFGLSVRDLGQAEVAVIYGNTRATEKLSEPETVVSDDNISIKISV